MSSIYQQMWFHVFFGMILYQVVSSIIDYQVVQRLEERRKKEKKVLLIFPKSNTKLVSRYEIRTRN